MNVLLLAAGYGTRLKPITDHTPKCLVPIHQKPLLQHWLEMLLPVEGSDQKRNINQILINTHYLPNQVNQFIDSSPWRNAVTIVHEPELLGTAGTILKNRDFLSQDGAFLLAHADNLTRFDPVAFATAHAERQADVEITMMTFDTDVPHSCGIVEQNQQNIVVGFHEKSPEFHGTRANAAVYIVEPSVIEFLESFGKDVIDMSTEVLPHYLGKMQTFHNADYHRDIGTPQSLALAEIEF